jgi:hypothetical protein
MSVIESSTHINMLETGYPDTATEWMSGLLAEVGFQQGMAILEHCYDELSQRDQPDFDLLAEMRAFFKSRYQDRTGIDEASTTSSESSGSSEEPSQGIDAETGPSSIGKGKQRAEEGELAENMNGLELSESTEDSYESDSEEHEDESDGSEDGDLSDDMDEITERYRAVELFENSQPASGPWAWDEYVGRDGIICVEFFVSPDYIEPQPEDYEVHLSEEDEILAT